MKSQMLTTRLFLLASCLFNVGCQAEPDKGRASDTAAERSLATKISGTGKAEVQPAKSEMGKIDPEPVATSRGLVVSKTDIDVNGKPACDFLIRYPEAVDQNVSWNGESCTQISARFIAVDELRRAGQLDDIAEEAKMDLERIPSKQVFYIESEFTASAYPLNIAGVVYEVSLAD
ncbi:MAG: hypothetical protein ABL928_15265 [Sphingorhabdus sp.]